MIYQKPMCQREEILEKMIDKYCNKTDKWDEYQKIYFYVELYGKYHKFEEKNILKYSIYRFDRSITNNDVLQCVDEFLNYINDFIDI